MTDTNNHHGNGGGVPQDCGKRVRVKQHEENIVNRKSAWALVWVCVCCCWWCVVSWSAVQCLAQH